MSAGLLGAALPQPIDDCLKTLGDLMVAGPLSAPVMSSSWQPVDLLGRFQGGEVKVRLGALSLPLARALRLANTCRDSGKDCILLQPCLPVDTPSPVYASIGFLSFRPACGVIDLAASTQGIQNDVKRLKLPGHGSLHDCHWRWHQSQTLMCREHG